MKGHWSLICRTTKYLVKLYQKSLKKKDKNVEANFTSQHLIHDDDDDDTNLEDVHVDITHLDVADFFKHPERRIDHLIGDDSVQRN